MLFATIDKSDVENCTGRLENSLCLGGVTSGGERNALLRKQVNPFHWNRVNA
jgi:hypothetical protein